MKYVLGIKIGKVDRLSKRPDWKVGIENNNENQIVIKDSWIHSMQEVVIEGLEVDIVEKIKKARSKDEEVVSMDHLVLVYKVANLIQSSLLSSLMLTQYKVYSLVQL